MQRGWRELGIPISCLGYRFIRMTRRYTITSFRHEGHLIRPLWDFISLMGSLWIDPLNYQVELETAVEILATRGTNVFNLQPPALCVAKVTLEICAEID